MGTHKLNQNKGINREYRNQIKIMESNYNIGIKSEYKNQVRISKSNQNKGIKLEYWNKKIRRPKYDNQIRKIQNKRISEL